LVKKHLNSEKLCLHKRSENEAGDKVKIFDYLKENTDKIFLDSTNNFLLALPTMPFRNSTHINEAIQQYEALEKPIFSAVEYDFSVSFAFSNNIDGTWNPLLDDSPMVTGNTRSQDQVEYFHPNGAIYIRSVDDLRHDGLNTLYDNAAPYFMRLCDSIDIDDEDDFEFAEIMANKI